MTYSYITNIRHFMPEDPTTELPEEAYKIREFLGLVIKAATSTEDAEFVSGLPCRKRVNRKPCPGALSIRREDIPHPFIYWHCTHCEDGGRISDWKGSWYDLSEWKEESQPAPDEKPIQAIVSREEYKALICPEINTYDPYSERIIFGGARQSPTGVVIRAFDEELDNLLGDVAADANHEKKRKRMKLMGSLYDKLQDAFDAAIYRKGLH